jgi:hypothetical protein
VALPVAPDLAGRGVQEPVVQDGLVQDVPEIAKAAHPASREARAAALPADLRARQEAKDSNLVLVRLVWPGRLAEQQPQVSASREFAMSRGAAHRVLAACRRRKAALDPVEWVIDLVARQAAPTKRADEPVFLLQLELAEE